MKRCLAIYFKEMPDKTIKKFAEVYCGNTISECNRAFNEKTGLGNDIVQEMYDKKELQKPGLKSFTPKPVYNGIFFE